MSRIVFLCAHLIAPSALCAVHHTLKRGLSARLREKFYQVAYSMADHPEKFLTLSSLSAKTTIERAALERMISRRIIIPDAELKFGEGYVPLFLETKACEIMLKRSDVKFRCRRLPSRQTVFVSQEPSAKPAP